MQHLFINSVLFSVALSFMSLTFFKCLEKFLKVYLIANEKGKREIANICEKIIPF